MTKAHTEIKAAYDRWYLANNYPANFEYRGPLFQKHTYYYIQFTQAIGKGIAQATPNINFTTVDTGVMGIPVIAGVGTGVGVDFDADFMERTMYTFIRQRVKDFFRLEKYAHDPYPPKPDNVGVYLQAICKATAQSIKEHYATCWTLASAHPTIYAGTGKINYGLFYGIQQSAVTEAIYSSASIFRGKFWHPMAEEIAKAYKLTIETRSKSTVVITGTCVPSISQVCNIVSGGTGTGTAT
jgi:hypothetical protein